MEIARDPYFMAWLGLIYAKKRRQKSHAWAPLRLSPFQSHASSLHKKNLS